MRAFYGLLLAVAVFAGGCTGDDSKSETVDSLESPLGYARHFIEVVADARTNSDCAVLGAADRNSLAPLSCPLDSASRRSVKSLDAYQAETYGTGATVGVKQGGRHRGSSIMFMDPSGSWQVKRFVDAGPPLSGTSDRASRQMFDRALAQYERSLRRGTCDASKADFNLQGQLACGVGFPTAPRLIRAAAAGQPIAHRYLGGNKLQGYYAVTTGPPNRGYWTVVLQTFGPGHETGKVYALPGPRHLSESRP